MKLEVVYGYNDQARPVGVVHLFLSAADLDKGRPLGGKCQSYLRAGADEEPKCQRCLKLIGKAS